MCCTTQTMKLVVMAAMLAVAGARKVCKSGCHLTNKVIQVELCGRNEPVFTTECAGHCYNKDSAYISNADEDKQQVCIGNWTYEVKQIQGCPESATYPVATHCECRACNIKTTHCGLFTGDPAVCPFK
ncbi:gonadotropin subunit beta-1 [Labrus bergylta]|uniref:Gonadotropin subunit beta-1-like n=1 Tax=Labrus bergylta TaxID=56723 RepID=A0A3Q3GL27_9LABR|nr:gonadotropin subunit beta-1-like [Labrus bergylta]